ncbi:MAG: hypothetical protein CMQ61_06675 [Gammaproteobacteria bacterium]|nr:hypothetical protein [Gammaproteobacteria bacterium]
MSPSQRIKNASISLLRKFSVGGVIIGMLWFLQGCASTPPAQEMSDARQALQAAVAAGAEEYVAADIGRARGFLKGAERAMALRHFDQARSGAVAAKRAALWARKVAASIDDAEQALRQARAAGRDVTTAEAELSRAKRAALQGQTSVAIERAESSRKLSETVLGS